MELSNIVSENGKELSFNIKNIDLPYLNGLTRIIMSEISSYAFDHMEIIHNSSVINNNKILNKISMIPIDKSIAFIINVKNDKNIKMHVTSSDMKFYQLNDIEFIKYLSGLGEKRYANKFKEYEKQGIIIESENGDEEIPEPTNVIELKKYLEENKNKSEISLHNLVEQDLQIVTLEPDGIFEAYGVAIPGIPKTHVKWQQGLAFKKQKKNVKKSETFQEWNLIIDDIIKDLMKIQSEEEFKKNKYIDLLFHVLSIKTPVMSEGKVVCEAPIDIIKNTTTPQYEDFLNIEWTDEFKKFIVIKIEEIIEKICVHIYKMDLKTHENYERCIPCIDQVSHLLKIDRKDIYNIERLNEYAVTIESNTRLSSILWNQSINIFVNKIDKLSNNIDVMVNVYLTEHKHQENGYILRLNGISHTLGNVIIHELRKESKISNCAYTHTHPLNEYIEIHIKWKKPTTNPKQSTTNILRQILNRNKIYIQQIPLIDQIS